MSKGKFASWMPRDQIPMQASMKLDKPGHTRVEVCCVVRTESRPCHHGTSDYRRVTKNLCRCCRFCGGVDKMFSADTRGNNEDDKGRNPGTVFVPAVGQKGAEVISITMLTSLEL
jgi:hypothetical protein